MAVKTSATITLSSVVDVIATTRYYLLQPSTLNKPAKPTTKIPTGGWTDTEPSYTSGSTNSLYTVDRTDFSDGTWLYSSVSLSSSYEAAKEAYNKAAAAQGTAEDAKEIVDNLSVGGVNLIEGSASYRLAAEGVDTFWMAADELEPDTAYTLSVKEVLLEAGQAAAVTWKVVNRNTGAAQITGTLDFTYGKQVRRFITPAASANYALYLYAGVSGTTTGVTVLFNRIKLEEGTMATAWSASPEDSKATISELAQSVNSLTTEMDDHIMELIDSLGLSEQYASASDFLAAVQQIELIRSDLATHDADMTLTFNRLTQTEEGLAQLFSSFVFGDDGGTPYLDMSTSDSSVKMRLTNTRMAFVQGGSELAYFSDNKLYVTRLEVVEQISIGTSTNGFLDIVTTPTGVGFKWRSS